MSKKIMIFEDNGSALKIADILHGEGYECYVTEYWTDAFGWVAFDPGIDAFTALIFDLRVPYADMPKVRGTDPYNEDVHGSPSLYFVKEYIEKKFPKLTHKIIWFSAFHERYEKHGLGEYHFVEKNDPKYVEKMIKYIRESE